MNRARGAILFSLLCLPAVAEHAPSHARPVSAAVPIPETLVCTPFHELILENGGMVPQTDAEWEALFAKHPSIRTDIFFSSSNARTSLEDPRRIYAFDTNADGSVKQPNYAGRLFTAVGTNAKGVRVAEFITTTVRGHGHLFGTYDPTGNPPIRVESVLECRECHKSEGPTYTIYPWTNSSSNIQNLVALVTQLARTDPAQYQPILDRIKRHGLAAKKEGSNSRRAIIGLLSRDPVIARAHSGGVPIFRGAFGATQGGPYLTFTDAFKLHNLVQATQNPHVYSQALAATSDPLARATVIERGLRGQLANQLAVTLGQIPEVDVRTFAEYGGPHAMIHRLGFPKELEGKKLPGLNSTLTLDYDFAKNELVGKIGTDATSIKQVDQFFDALSMDKDFVSPILSYNARRAQHGGVHPDKTEFTPKEPKHFDLRGVDEQLQTRPASVQGVVVPERLDSEGFVLSYLRGGGEQINSNGFTGGDASYLNGLVGKAIERIEAKKAVSAAEKEKLREAAFQAAMESSWMKAIYQRGTIPNRSELKLALVKALGEHFLKIHGDSVILDTPQSEYLSAFEIDCLKRLNQPAPVGTSCVRCHGSATPLGRALGDLQNWGKDVVAKKPEALALQAKVRRYLEKDQMPPADSIERLLFDKSEEREKLRRFVGLQ